MNEKDLKLALSVVLSFPLAVVLFFLLKPIWTALFPYSAHINQMVKFDTPSHIAIPIGAAIFFFVLFEFMEREKISDPKSPLTLAVLTFLVFLAYYIGLSGFYFYRFFSTGVHYVTFSYFLYVPYWMLLGGLVSSWLFYRLEIPNLFKKEEHSTNS